MRAPSRLDRVPCIVLFTDLILLPELFIVETLRGGHWLDGGHTPGGGGGGHSQCHPGQG